MQWYSESMALSFWGEPLAGSTLQFVLLSMTVVSTESTVP